ncbi:hypothetical protein E6O75_ATG08375 [Venturia nashicola]|uniref:HORMA domain-containing protein n=1 Tax=Venturia nashicola TaxID=86259 RepID=A0A4Z1NV08_9PEZI|nr:hypothetical protein E6O75_ATG08375 [Venturia nashicola]
MAAGQAVKVRGKTSTTVTTAQATKNATSTAQLVTQKQSQELAQTLVHGSISCIAYLRDLFPDQCFEEHGFSSSDKHISYKDHASGKSQSRSGGSKLRALRRGHNDNVDSFLDMLEKGAFEALEKKVLHAIQINISEQEDKPNHVVESYTFTFSYQTSLEGAKTLAGVTMQDPSGCDTTVKNVKYALHMFIRKIIALCETLPELPARKYLYMQLYYTDDCERAYELPGFVACEDTRLWFAEHDGWTRQTQDCGVLDAGYHAVSLKLSHLQQDLEVAATQDDAAQTAIPKGLEYTTVSSGQDNIDASIGLRLAKRKLVQRTAAEQTRSLNADEISVQRLPSAPIASQQESMDIDEDTPLQAISRMSLGTHENLTDVQAQIATATETQASTQTREDKATRGRLAKMMIPSSQAQHTEETQIVNSPAPHVHTMDYFSQAPRLQLSEAKVKDLEKRKSPTNTRRSKRISERDETEDISCECGDTHGEDDMVDCHFCGRWQHLICYGYQNSTDTRVPEVHACYKCLLQEKEGPLLTELEHVTLLRKGISVAIKDGIHGDRQLAETLHCDTQTAAQLIKHLKNEGFLLRVKNASKAGFKKTGRPMWYVVEDEEKRAKMLGRYFDPTSKIAHHFEIPRQLPDTAKTTQFPLPPGDTTLSAIDDSTLRDDTPARSRGVPNNMEVNDRPADLAETPVAVHHEPLSESPGETLIQESQRQEPIPEIPIQITPTSRAKRLRDPLSERNPNPSTPVRLSSKRPAYDQEEDESSTPTPERKKIKASRARVVNVGRSPAASVASFVATPVPSPIASSYVGSEDMDDDDAL